MENKQLVIYKYKLEPSLPENIQYIQVPADWNPLYVGEQKKSIFIWGLCSKTKETIKQHYLTLPTGLSISAELLENYYPMGMVQMKNGLVFHIFLMFQD